MSENFEPVENFRKSTPPIDKLIADYQKELDSMYESLQSAGVRPRTAEEDKSEKKKELLRIANKIYSACDAIEVILKNHDSIEPRDIAIIEYIKKTVSDQDFHLALLSARVQAQTILQQANQL